MEQNFNAQHSQVDFDVIEFAFAHSTDIFATFLHSKSFCIYLTEIEM